MVGNVDNRDKCTVYTGKSKGSMESVQCKVSSCKVILQVKSVSIIPQIIIFDDSGDAVVACEHHC